MRSPFRFGLGLDSQYCSNQRYPSGVRGTARVTALHAPSHHAMDANVGPALAELPATRRALLIALRKRGEARAEELAEQLDVTVSAVRQHLQGLAAADL
ncbi:MAG TPA: helix-turn-helix domain-containing protein, partial [Conexibacter sp.]|nr:helix-turn-helix domain-containing protein [Conexibacter sp.]